MKAEIGTEKKVVAFDYGNVLARGVKNYDIIFGELGEKFGFDIKSNCNKIRNNFNEWSKGRINEKDFWTKISEISGKELPLRKCARHWIERYTELSEPVPAIYELAKRVKEAGFVTGIISNLAPPHSAYNRATGKFDGFDVVIVSAEVGYRKPEKEIYEIFLKEAKVNGRDCIFIDDLDKNVAAAKKIGMTAIKFGLDKDEPAALEEELERILKVTL